MNDKLQQLYDLYKQKGIISTTDFNTFASASEDQRQKLYDLGVQKGLFNTTDFGTFNNAWGGSKQEPVKKKESTVFGSAESSSAKLPKTEPKVTESLPSKGKPDGSYSFPGEDNAIYKKENGQWYKAFTSDYKFYPITKGDVENRVSSLEKNALSTEQYGFEKEPRVEAPQKYQALPKQTAPAKPLTTAQKQQQAVFDKSFGVVSEAEYQKRKAESDAIASKVGQITSDLIDYSEGDVVPRVQEIIKDYPYLQVSESGVGYDELEIKNTITGESQKINLDNWSSDRDKEEAKRLQGFLDIQMSSKDYVNQYDKVNKLRAQLSTATPTQRIDLSEKLLEEQAKLTELKNGRYNKAKSDKYKAAAIYDKNAKENIKTDFAKLQIQAIDYSEKAKSYSEWEATVNDAKAKGLITQEQYDMDYAPKLAQEKNMLIEERNKINENFKQTQFESTSIDNIAADNFAIEAERGNIITGTAFSALQGAENSLRFLLETGPFEQGDFKGLLTEALPGSISTEYTSSESRNVLEQIVFALANSGGSALVGAAVGSPRLGLYASSYVNMKDQMSTPEFKDVPEWQKILMSGVYGATIGYLEEKGIGKWFQKTPAGKGLTNWILKKTIAELGEDATTEAIELSIKKNLNAAIANGLIQVTASGLVEGSTELAQEAADMVYKDVFNKLSEKKYFENPDSWAGVADRLSQSFLLGFAGGSGMNAISQTTQIAKNELTKSQVNNIAQLIDDPELYDTFKLNLKDQILSGQISKEEARRQVEKINEVQGTLNQIPKDVDRYSAFKLINERDEIQKQIEGKDPNLVAAQTERVKEINDQLKQLSYAVQEQGAGAVPVQSGAGVSTEMEEGVSETKPQVVTGEEVKVEGPQAEVTQEEVVQPSEEDNSFVYKMNTERTSKGKGKWEDDFEIIDNRNGIELGEEASKWAVVNKITGEIVDAKSKKDAQDIVKNAPAYGDMFGDGTTVDFTELSEQAQNKYREQFNQQKTKVVEEVVQPVVQETVQAEVQTEPTAKIESIEVQEVPQVEQSLNDLTQQNNVLTENDFTAARIRNVGKEKVVAQIQKAAKAIAKVLPNVKIVVHATPEAFVEATKDMDGRLSEGGLYDQQTGQIHINLEKATNRTVAHEVFHALILSRVKSDVEAQRLTRSMIGAVRKSLKKAEGTAELISYLEDFEKDYDNNIKNEEKLAELFGILADNYKQLPPASKNIIIRFLNRLAKALGLKEMTDREAIQFMNTLSRKVETGQEIEVSEVGQQKDGEFAIRKQKGLINLTDQEALKYARAGVENKYDAQAIKQIGLQGTKFDKQSIIERIQKEFDGLVKNTTDYIFREDSPAIDQAIQNDIDTMVDQGFSNDQIERAKRALKPGPERDNVINSYRRAQVETANQWESYLGQSDYPASFKYLILDAVLTNNYDLKTDRYQKRTGKTIRNFTPFDAGTLAELYMSDSNELLKDYVRIQADNSANIVESAAFSSTKDGKWIKFDGGDGVSQQELQDNANKLSQLVQNTYWCTKTNALSQLRDGDFYVYVTENKQGDFDSRIAVRMNGDRVGEVRGNASAKQDLEADMLPVADTFLREKIPNDSGKKWLDSIAYNTKVKDLTEKIDNKVLDMNDVNEYIDIIKDKDKFSVDYGENGLVQTLKNKFRNANFSFGVADWQGGIKDDTLLLLAPNDIYTFMFRNNEETKNVQVIIGNVNIYDDFDGGNVKAITGNVEFEDSSVKKIKSIESIGGDVRFRNSEIKDLGSIESIGGDVSFRNSEVKYLGNLESIGGRAVFRDSEVRSLENLKYIGGRADFYDSFVEDLGSLKEIGGDADFENSEIINLDGLKKIGGNANFHYSDVESLGALELIGGHADFANSKIESLGRLKQIGGNAIFQDSNVKDLGDLESIRFGVWFNDKIKDLGKLKPVARGKASFGGNTELEKQYKERQKRQFAVRKQKLAPNGKPSNLDDKQWEQVRTPEFKAWFGDWENDPEKASKVVDENGEPLVVSHFTDQKFDVFKYKEGGFHFGDASLKEDLEIAKGKNLPIELKVFLNIKSPLRIEDSPRFFAEDILKQLERESEYLLSDETIDDLYGKFIDIDEGNFQDPETKKSNELIKEVEKLGIDGYIYENKFDSQDSKSSYIIDEENSKIYMRNEGVVVVGDVKKLENTNARPFITFSSKSGSEYYAEKNEADEINESDKKRIKELIDDGNIIYTINSPKTSSDFELFTGPQQFNDSYIAFHPNQIKSATENVGTFSEREFSIRKQKTTGPNRIVENGVKAGKTDAEIRQEGRAAGFTNKEMTEALSKYYTKEQGVFMKSGIKGKVGQFVDFAKRWKQKYLTTKGLLAKIGFTYKEKMEGEISAEANRAAKTAKKFGVLFDKFTGDKELLKDAFDKVLRGDKSIQLPTGFAGLANEMRNHIDRLSQMLIDSGAVDADMADTIRKNIGAYITRSYEIFDNKNFRQKVGEQELQAAKNFLRTQPGMIELAKAEAARTGVTVDEALDVLVDNKIDEYFADAETGALVKGSRLGSKDLSTLKERKEIPEQIRMLMGEYSDPAMNYARTVLNIATLAARHQFLTQVKEAGMGKFFFEKNDSQRPKGFDTEIAAEGSDTMSPLNGLMTTPEIAEAFGLYNGQKGEDSWYSQLSRIYYKAMALVKWLKTIASVGTHMKNVFSNFGFVGLNGHSLIEIGKAAKVVAQDLKTMSKPEVEAKIDEYIKAGIMRQGAGINEIRDMFKDADMDGFLERRLSMRKPKGVMGRIKQAISSRSSKIISLAEDLYQAEDDMFKIAAYETEMNRYADALYNKSKDQLTDKERQEVSDIAANNVKNTYPTYSRIPEGIKQLRKFPLFIGSFISFQAESYRTAYNTIALAKDELSSDNKKIKGIGARRVAGAGAYLTAKTALLSYAGYAAGTGLSGVLGALFNDDDEEEKEKDVRSFLPPWSKNSDLIILKAADGEIEYIDFSASDPHGGINKALNALFSGEDMLDSFKQSTLELVGQFQGPDILTNLAIQLKNNENDFGKSIYNEEDAFQEKTAKILDYVYKVVEPGTATSIRKGVFSEQSLGQLAFGEATGLKIRKSNVKEQFGYKLSEFDESFKDARKIYNSEYYKNERLLEDSKATNKEINEQQKKTDESLVRANEKYAAKAKELMDLINSANRLGVDYDELIDQLETIKSTMGKSNIYEMEDGGTEFIKEK